MSKNQPDFIDLTRPPPADAKRDCVHVPVLPLVAGESLMPGQRFALDAAGRAVLEPVDSLGVVNPFSPAVVLAGETFWALLYPGSIDSLRHAWTHPAFRVGPPAQPR